MVSTDQVSDYGSAVCYWLKVSHEVTIWGFWRLNWIFGRNSLLTWLLIGLNFSLHGSLHRAASQYGSGFFNENNEGETIVHENHSLLQPNLGSVLSYLSIIFYSSQEVSHYLILTTTFYSKYIIVPVS